MTCLCIWYHRVRKVTFFVVAASLLSIAANAQSPVRDPTPAEKKVIEKYTNVIDSFLDTFDSDDWDTKVDFDVDESV